MASLSLSLFFIHTVVRPKSTRESNGKNSDNGKFGHHRQEAPNIPAAQSNIPLAAPCNSYQAACAVPDLNPCKPNPKQPYISIKSLSNLIFSGLSNTLPHSGTKQNQGTTLPKESFPPSDLPVARSGHKNCRNVSNEAKAAFSPPSPHYFVHLTLEPSAH